MTLLVSLMLAAALWQAHVTRPVPVAERYERDV